MLFKKKDDFIMSEKQIKNLPTPKIVKKKVKKMKNKKIKKKLKKYNPTGKLIKKKGKLSSLSTLKIGR